MITVIAEIIIKPGRRDSVLEKITQLLPQVLQEKGCHRYEPFLDVKGHIPTPSLCWRTGKAWHIWKIISRRHTCTHIVKISNTTSWT
jgi:quinol monooxygenase YgiN